MDKQKKYFILAGIVILLVLIVIILVSVKNQNEANNAGTNQTENNSALPSLNATNTDNTAVTETTPPPPVYTKKIALEIMTATEMKKMGFAPGSKIQVLGRDASGTVTDYRPMQNDKDIMEFFGN